MKRCPSCGRTFDDEALSFCLDDGTTLVGDIPSAPADELQSAMVATPPQLGDSSYPPPPPPQDPDSGSFNPLPPNTSLVTPATALTSTPHKSGGINKKLIFVGVGCVGLAVIVGIVAIVLLFAFSGPSSKMNPYKGDLKELAPEKVGEYTRVDVDVLTFRDRNNFGKINEAIGVSYQRPSDAEIKMFVGNYASSKDAEDGLKSFRDATVTKGWTASDVGKKKLGWSTVGIRYTFTKDVSTGKADDKVLQDGAVIVLTQSSTPAEGKQLQYVGWTNGSVVQVVAADAPKAVDFEKIFDAAVK